MKKLLPIILLCLVLPTCSQYVDYNGLVRDVNFDRNINITTKYITTNSNAVKDREQYLRTVEQINRDNVFADLIKTLLDKCEVKK